MSHVLSSEKEEFRFTWKIENFSMCGDRVSVALQSPSFTVGILEKTDWHLNLYPKGHGDDFIVCDLVRENDSGPSSVTVDLQLSLVITDRMPRFEIKPHSSSYARKGSSSHKLMKRASLFKKKCMFLPKDTLTVMCDIRQTTAGSSTTPISPAVKALVHCLYGELTDVQACKLSEDVYTMTGRDVVELKRKLYPYNNECLALTRIGVEHRSFNWQIKKFSCIKPKQQLTLPLPCSSKRVPPLILTMSLKNDSENVQIDVRKMAKSELGTFYVVCKIAVLDIDGREHSRSEKDYTFASPTTDEIWQFPSFFTKDKLMKDKGLCLPNDVLYLRFECAISTGQELSQIEDYNFVTLTAESATEVEDVGSVTEDLRAFYANTAARDVTLKTKEKTFPAHKSILAFRSPVFCAMFEHDTEEKQTGTVDIPDVDPKTLQKMIEFMYTDTVDFVRCDNVRKLYIAADKYQVVALKRKCASYLISNLSQKNVFDILLLAHQHEDEKLLNPVYDYLYEPPYDSFFSSEFESFIESNTRWAFEVLRIWIGRLKAEIALEF